MGGRELQLQAPYYTIRKIESMKLIAPNALWRFAEKARNGIIMGIDVGDRKIGIALSNADKTEASPYKMIYRKRDKSRGAGQAAMEIEQLVKKRGNICGIVAGWPLELDDSEGDQCLKTHRFMRTLLFRGEIDVPLTYWDERYTSMDAEEKWGPQRGLDMFAAVEILQNYMDEMGSAEGALSPE